MSDNLPPDFRDDTREHYPRCASLCDYADVPLDIDKGIDLFMALTADLSWWKSTRSGDVEAALVTDIQNRLNAAAARIECPFEHRSHHCTCEDIASSGDPWDTADDG